MKSLTNEQDANPFGYRISHRPDGLVDLIDAPPGIGCNGLMFLFIGTIFTLFALCLALAASGIPALQCCGFQDGGAGRWPVAALFLALGGLGCAIGGQVFVRRAWTIESSTFTRRTELMGTPFTWGRTQRLDRIDIVHAIWRDGKGLSDSVIGIVVDPYREEIVFERFDVPAGGNVYATTAFFSHPEAVERPQVSPQIPVGDPPLPTVETEVTPRAWWLGHWLARVSGLPLNIESQVVSPVDLSGP